MIKGNIPTYLLIQHVFNDNLQNLTFLWIWWLVHLVGDWLQVACFVKSILSWRAKRRNFYCVRFCQQCASYRVSVSVGVQLWSLIVPAWLALVRGSVLSSIRTSDNNTRQEECDSGYACFKLSLPYSLWECCVMVTLIRDIDIWPNYLSLAIIFLIYPGV